MQKKNNSNLTWKRPFWPISSCLTHKLWLIIYYSSYTFLSLWANLNLIFFDLELLVRFRCDSKSMSHRNLLWQGQESQERLDTDSQGSSQSFDLESRNSNQNPLWISSLSMTSSILKVLNKEFTIWLNASTRLKKVKDLEWSS